MEEICRRILLSGLFTVAATVTIAAPAIIRIEFREVPFMTGAEVAWIKQLLQVLPRSCGHSRYRPLPFAFRSYR
jgi:hypothetical protein